MRSLILVVASIVAICAFAGRLSAQNLVFNGSFEYPTVSGWQSQPPSSDWFYYGAGISAGGGYGTTGPIPDGNQYCYVQSLGDYISEQVILPVSGTYLLSYYAGGRSSGGSSLNDFGGNTDYGVYLGNSLLSAGTTQTNMAMTQQGTYFTASAGTQTLRIQVTGVTPSGSFGTTDQTALFDDISITPKNAGITYDAAASLTEAAVAAGANPNGSWSYGSRSSAASSAFVPFSISGVYPHWLPATQNVEGWMGPTVDGDGNLPCVLENFGNTPATYSGTEVTLRPGVMVLDPAEGSSAYSVVRWTAPQSGTYLLSTLFAGLDPTGTTTDVHVVMDGDSLFDGNILGGLGAATNVQEYSTTINVTTGDTIDFAVGPGGNGYYSDSTTLSASLTLVPEPSTFALLGVGFVCFGAYAWRRRMARRPARQDVPDDGPAILSFPSCPSHRIEGERRAA